jgi:hypothetical protein
LEIYGVVEENNRQQASVHYIAPRV